MLVKVDNILLLGTSHVAKESVEEIKKTIEVYEPEVVALELDLRRLRRLLAPKDKKQKQDHFASLKEFGVGGYLFMLFGSAVQQRIGKQLGIEPGADMKAGYDQARKNKIPVSLIDIDITHTAKKISRIPFFKKVKSFGNLIVKSFNKEYRKKLEFDIEKGVPDHKVIENALEVFEKEVPELYKVLIDDRNVHMAKRLQSLQNLHQGYILAVVGAGHLKGMEEYLKKNRTTDGTFSFTVHTD